MDVHAEMERRGARCQCVRCREVRSQKVELTEIHLDELLYPTAKTQEYFLSFVTPEDTLVGFVRLSLPSRDSPSIQIADLEGAALIREVHVYGQSLPVGGEKEGAAQHIGLGTRLLSAAEGIARDSGYSRLAVIAAVGTRRYYEGRGFKRGSLYLVKDL